MAESLGKSGAIFMLTHDSQFHIKTITLEERDIITNRLNDGYAEYLA